MNSIEAFSPVPLLVLARLLPASDKGETRDKLSQDLKPLVEHRWEGSAWVERLDRAVAELESAGSIVRVAAAPAKGKKKTEAAPRFALGAEGRRAVLKTLGLEELPPGTTWKRLLTSRVLPVALGVRTSASGPSAKKLDVKAAIVRTHFGLALDDHPTFKQAGDAAAGKLLGLEPGAAFTANTILRKLLHDAGIAVPPGPRPPAAAVIQEAIFRRELGDPGARKPLEAIAARSVGARRNSPAELGIAALRSWVERSENAAPAANVAPVPPDAPAEPIDLPGFAVRVLGAARTSPSGWFGDAKVFIAHVWRSVRDDPAFSAMDADAFKAQLIEAHRARLLELGRADLVEAMDPADVRESATPYLDAVYHFVRTEDHAR